MKRKHNFINRLGERWLTNEGYWVIIIEYLGVRDCTIKFDSGLIIENIQYGNVKRGQIKNPYHPSIYGVGYNGVGRHITKKGSDRKMYNTWLSALERSYCEKWHLKQPTYIECTTDEFWYNFQNFGDWYEENFNPEFMQGWELDKDILCKGNKVYSSSTCCFVPHEINTLFTRRDKARGDFPIGITKTPQGKYRVILSKNSRHFDLGTYKTVEEAFHAYKVGKELWIKEVADKWRGQITEPCYEAMYRYEVEITD